MRILIIGGRGNISWTFTNEMCRRKNEVWVLNRGITINTRRIFLDNNMKLVRADIRNEHEIRNKLMGIKFD